jgi:16S rRNA (guanine966-N2)-methyltransferase
MAQQRNQVRIVGGHYRRRLLSFPDSQGLRPTPDRVRETLFNWLGQELAGWRCLDLFAGSGALGFEAASRGAARVVMVEKSRPVAASLRANRALLDAKEIEVVEIDAFSYIRNTREKFDLILVDPPFDADWLPQLLPTLPALLTDEGLVYIEARWLPDLSGWEVLRDGKAGQVKHALLRPGVPEGNTL